ncbi:MAG: hypothetical protein AAF705_09430 [Bacteroidota bacterium]
MITQKNFEKALLKKGKAQKNRLKWRDGSILSVSKLTPHVFEVRQDRQDGNLRPPVLYYFTKDGHLRRTTFKVKWQAIMLYAVIPLAIGVLGVGIDAPSKENLKAFIWIAPGALAFALLIQYLASLKTQKIVRKAIDKAS